MKGFKEVLQDPMQRDEVARRIAKVVTLITMAAVLAWAYVL